VVDIPEPKIGLVIRYSYLWESDHAQRREDGAKDRPAVVILVVETTDGRTSVVVVPITHTKPAKDDGIELPAATAKRLGLDSEPQWIIISELNYFSWPGHDIRPVPRSRPETIAYGELPQALTNTVLDKLRARVRAGTAKRIPRT